MQIDDPAEIAGAEVRSTEGDLLGQVSAVHVPEGADEPLFAQVTGRRFGDAESIVPLVDAVTREGQVIVPYSAEEVAAGPTVEPDTELSVGEAASIIAYYGAGPVDFGRLPLTERASGTGDVASQDPEVRRLPPIVVVRPGIESDGPPAGAP